MPHLENGRNQVAGTVDREGWQAFEQPLPHCFFHTARTTPGLVVDIGANTGFYSLLAACASKRNHVVAFEPFPAIFAVIGRNVAANRRGGRVRTDGSADFHIPS